MKNNMTINILHLYPDLLNLYGDKGNIECMRKRLEWRGIKANVNAYTENVCDIDFDNTDIILLGGGSDREQELVASRLLDKKTEFKNYVENGGALLALCGGYELLGKEYLGVLDICTDRSKNTSRLIGNVIIECDGLMHNVVGFENHDGRIHIGDYKALGRIILGYGNDGDSGYEGVQYKNLIGTYLHGPLFPKNPELCDRFILGALKNKYGDDVVLDELDDKLENKANEYMVKKLLG